MDGRLTQEPEGRLRRSIGLGQHRRSGLDQDVETRKLSALRGHIDILDPAVGCREILVEDGQLLAGEIKPLNVGSNLRPHIRQGLDGRLDIVQSGGSSGAAGNRDPTIGVENSGCHAACQVGRVHTEGGRIAVNGNGQTSAGKQAHSIERSAGDIADVILQLAELSRVVGKI